MLWQQESSSAIYVDILKNISFISDYAKLNNNKNNNESYVARTLGNKKYAEGDYKGAILLYNKGLCHAEKRSEFLSLCYSNRSMCFLQLGLYDKCLVDIRLAKSGNCPDASLKKLELREKKCLEMLTSQAHSSEKSLCGAERELPFISSGIIIEKNPKYGRMIVAIQGIKMGDTLVVEENYIRTEKSFDFNKCTQCSNLQMNFVPCEKCIGAMYCDKLCEQKNIFHELECEMLLEKDHCCDGLHLPFILRSIIIGVNSFETIAQMMECVAKWILVDPFEINKTLTSPISKYKAFFMLSTVKPQQQVSRFRKTAYMIFNSVMKSTILGSRFQTTADKRFLAHLIVHHCGIIQTNTFGESSTDKQDTLGHTDSNAYHSISIDLISSYFNHSCVPNVLRLERGNLTVIKAISPIQAGEQLFLTYLEAFEMNLHERINQLETIYGFNCECKLCIDGVMHVRGLENDRIFLQICSESSKVSLDNFDIALILKVKELCIEFFINHPKYITSRETNHVKDVFGECLRRLLIQY